MQDSEVLRINKKLTSPKKLVYKVFNLRRERKWTTGPWFRSTEHIEIRTHVIRASDTTIDRAIRRAIDGLANNQYYTTAIAHCSHKANVSQLIGAANWTTFKVKSDAIFKVLQSAMTFPALTIKSDPDLLAAGRAGVCNCVKASGSTLSGGFEISITAKPDEQNWNVDVLAGIIAHEMLHQCGFGHKAGSYLDDNFITVYGDLVQNKGVFVQRRNQTTLVGSTRVKLCGN